MNLQPDEKVQEFKVGDAVRAAGKSRVLRVVECRTAIPHVYMEPTTCYYYRCAWAESNGETCSAWFTADKLDKAY